MPRAILCLASLMLAACNAHQEPVKAVGAEPAVGAAPSAPLVAEAAAPQQVAPAVAVAPQQVAPAEALAPQQTVTTAATPVAAGNTPGGLYAACRDRMEKPESDGECKVDGDCAIAGCSREVCTNRTAAGDIFTTCEVRPCFRAVTTCGCKEGRCTWNLADKMPEGTWHKIDLPEDQRPR
jgi:eight-cysteine-cluster-containing protein